MWRGRSWLHRQAPRACVAMIPLFQVFDLEIMSITCSLFLSLSCYMWKSGWVLLKSGCIVISAAHMQKPFITRTAMSRCVKYLHSDSFLVIPNYMCKYLFWNHPNSAWREKNKCAVASREHAAQYVNVKHQQRIQMRIELSIYRLPPNLLGFGTTIARQWIRSFLQTKYLLCNFPCSIFLNWHDLCHNEPCALYNEDRSSTDAAEPNTYIRLSLMRASALEYSWFIVGFEDHV